MQRSDRLAGLLELLVEIGCALESLVDEDLSQTVYLHVVYDRHKYTSRHSQSTNGLLGYHGALGERSRDFDGRQFARGEVR